MQITTTTIRLRTGDGEMKCYQAQARGAGKFPAVLVIMEAFGVNDHIKDVTERIATEGYVGIAPDLYYREPLNVVGYDQLQAAIGLMQKLDVEKAMADLERVIAHLRAQNFVHGDRLGITGFCMGGTLAFLAACRFPTDIKAAVSFYGGGIADDSPTAALNSAAELRAPILCFFGENDPYIPLSRVKKIDDTLRHLGKSFEVKVYSGADHGFFCDDRASYHPEAAQDAWERTKTWFADHLRR
ncbi:MAG TPA: dienelactone hydrolase family protein [Candidatus Tectomicrobia bacterium]|nr:dienelactone hydrolase family protein [Candidatus Tectomicrobia bacterium]